MDVRGWIQSQDRSCCSPELPQVLVLEVNLIGTEPISQLEVKSQPTVVVFHRSAFKIGLQSVCRAALVVQDLCFTWLSYRLAPTLLNFFALSWQVRFQYQGGVLVQGFWLPYFAHLSICFLPCLPYSYLFLLCLTFNLALLLYSACLPDLFSAPTLI